MWRTAVRNFISQGVSLAASLADRVLLTAIFLRSWGTDRYSDWASITSAATMVSILELGYQIQYGNRLSELRIGGKDEEYRRLVRIGVWIYAALSVAIVALIVAIAASVSVQDALKLRVFGEGRGTTLFVILSCTSTLHLARASMTQIYRSQGEFHRGIYADTAGAALTVLCGAAFVSSGCSPFFLAMAYLAAELVGWAAIARDVACRYKLDLAPAVPSPAELSRQLRSSGWYAILSSIPTVWVQAPVVLIASMGLGGSALAAFVTQRSLVNLGRTTANILSMSVGVELANAALAGDAKVVLAGARAVVRLNAVVAGLLAGGTLSFGPEIVGVWTGHPELASRALLGALLAPVVMSVAGSPLAMLSMYANYPRPSAIGQVTQVIFGLAAAALGAWKGGVLGAAIGLALGEILGTGLVLPLLAAPHFKLSYIPLLVRSLGISTLVCILSWLAGDAWVWLVRTDGLGWLAFAIPSWAAVIALPLLVWGLPSPIRRRVWGNLKVIAHRVTGREHPSGAEPL